MVDIHSLTELNGEQVHFSYSDFLVFGHWTLSFFL